MFDDMHVGKTWENAIGGTCFPQKNHRRNFPASPMVPVAISGAGGLALEREKSMGLH